MWLIIIAILAGLGLFSITMWQVANVIVAISQLWLPLSILSVAVVLWLYYKWKERQLRWKLLALSLKKKKMI